MSCSALGLFLCPWIALTARKVRKMLTVQFTDKLTHQQSDRGLVNSRTNQVVDSDFFYITKRLIYLHTKQKPNTDPNPSTTESVQWCNLTKITFIALLTANFKSNVSASWLISELTSPQLIWPRVGCRRIVGLPEIRLRIFNTGKNLLFISTQSRQFSHKFDKFSVIQHKWTLFAILPALFC